MIKRNIQHELLTWKASPDRKVLLLRGGRQVGKTYSVRELAKSYASFLEINFLETPEVNRFFQTGNLDPGPLLEKLQAFSGVSLSQTEGLLFLDEIQACPDAITGLRFFYEKMPNLHVIAAGSLLEFALQEIPSFGVGRIESLFMYPLSMKEFFLALGQDQLWKHIEKSSEQKPLDALLHEKAVEVTKVYSIIGGLPEVVNRYIEHRDIPRCMKLLADLALAYEDDFAKYKTRISPEKLRVVLLSIARQAGGKFVYSHVQPGVSTSGFDTALDLLCRAGLAYKIHCTHANGVPLAAEMDLKKFKVIPFDLGLYNALLQMRPADILLADGDAFMHKGALAETLCGLELIVSDSCRQKPALFYWSRETRGTNAELDYVISQSSRILPIEVKAGTRGQMQSLHQFLFEKKRGRGIRTSLENFSSYLSSRSQAQVWSVPLYAVGEFLFRDSPERSQAKSPPVGESNAGAASKRSRG